MFRFTFASSASSLSRPALLLGIFALSPAAALRAQVPAPPAASSSGRDTVTILFNINDLGLLRALLPLKLTAPEISALKDVFAKLIEEDKARVRQDEDGLRALAADVEQARTAALAGEPISTELEARVAATAKAAQDRERTARNRAIQRVLAVVKQSFTPEQQKQMAAQSMKVPGGKRVPREYAPNPEKAPPSVVQDLAVAFFIEKVLLNDRAPQVIGALKPFPAPEALAGSGDAAPPAKPDN